LSRLKIIYTVRIIPDFKNFRHRKLGWNGPYGGVPPFDKVQVAHFKPALEAAMAENLAEIDKSPTIQQRRRLKTRLPKWNAPGSTLERVSTVYGIWAGNDEHAGNARVESEMGPKLAAFSDKITQNEALFRASKRFTIRPKNRN
jgi:peptidyl-dipeptidase Dcp